MQKSYHRLPKRIIALFAFFAFVLGSVIVYIPANAAYTIYSGGTWWDNRQCIRISVYNITLGNCEATMDYFFNGERLNSDGTTCVGSYDQLRTDYSNAYNNGYEIIFGNGCKLDYLLEYYDDPGMDIKDISLRTVSARDRILNSAKSDKSELLRGLTPLYCLDTYSSDIYLYDDQYSFSNFLFEIKPYLFQWLFTNMGYYFYDTGSINTSEYTYLGPDYIIVLEPVYWFYDLYRTDKGTMFYGTATEWAIYNQQNLDHYVSSYGVHGYMGSLTCVAGPLSCRPTRDRVINFEDGHDPLELSCVTEKRNQYVRKWKDDHRSAEAIDRVIFEELGMDFLAPNELYDMTIEIENFSFHTNTEGILSFSVETTGKRAFAPAAADILSGGDYYGIKLVLETYTGSDLRLGDVVIYSDGIPDLPEDSFEQSIKTYIYDTWNTGSKTGEWIFVLHAYDCNNDKIIYDSNSGTPLDPENENTDYIFNISVSDPSSVLQSPNNTTADDKAPKGFTAPSGEISGLIPQTTASWVTYTAYAHEKSDGEQVVFFVKNDFTKTVDMDGTKPVCYDNIASAYINRAGELVTRSGYGIGISAESNVSGSCDGLSGGFQNGVVLYPEYSYSTYGSFLESDGRGGFYLSKNEYSKYYSDSRNSIYSRVHFTPIWYPDGEYNIQVYMFDCWTPVGMLWDCKTYTVRINGTMYDDWYVTRN